MKKTKKRCLSIFVLITLFFMSLASSITIKSCKEQTSDAESISESVTVSSVDKKSTCGGTLYGYTVSSYCWSWNPISNVLVTTGLQGKSTISDGYYSISVLPLNVAIRVTARMSSYYSDSKIVTLTNYDTEEYLILDLQPFMGKLKAKNIRVINNLFSLISMSANARSDFFSAFSFFV